MKISDIIDDADIIIIEDGKYYKAIPHNTVIDGWECVTKVILKRGKRISKKELLSS